MISSDVIFCDIVMLYYYVINFSQLLEECMQLWKDNSEVSTYLELYYNLL
jgi:hypothetical protein